jgi:type II secretory pathway pseudopilin PulG
MMITLLVFLAILVIGLAVAVPVWQTQVQRENEEELIFRGNQFVEGIRIFEQKNPGATPKDLDDLVEKKCLRRHYRDPMTAEGKWYLVTQSRAAGPAPGQRGGLPPAQRGGRGGLTTMTTPRQNTSVGSFSLPGQAGGRDNRLLLVPEDQWSGVQNMRIIGVASMSERDSIRVYNDATKYNEWLFYLGQDSGSKPEVAIYGREDEEKE